MMKRRHLPSKSFVKHPRYGSHPHVSGVKVPELEIRASFWSLQDGEIYPDSVLLANTEQQNYSVFPRQYYVDIRRVCRACDRPFIFFAKEQRYWFETLKFFVDADCVQCPDCRSELRAVQRRIQNYSNAMAKKTLNDKELDGLVKDAVFLFERGALKNLSILGAIKNRALKQLPGFDSTHALALALDQARLAQQLTEPTAQTDSFED